MRINFSASTCIEIDGRLSADSEVCNTRNVRKQTDRVGDLHDDGLITSWTDLALAAHFPRL